MKSIVTEHVVSLPGRASDPDFHLATYQCGQGPAVVFVHGFPDLARGWQHQLPAVGNAGFRAIAPDMRGYGGSSCPEASGLRPMPMAARAARMVVFCFLFMLVYC